MKSPVTGKKKKQLNWTFSIYNILICSCKNVTDSEINSSQFNSLFPSS